MSERIGVLLVFAALLACKQASKSEATAAAAGSVTPAAASAAASAVPAAPEYDAFGTKKSAGKLNVTFVRGVTVGNAALVAFRLENQSDEEQTVSSIATFQVSTPNGEVGKLNIMQGQCDGAVAPRGVMACALQYDFTAPPTEVQIRVATDLLSKGVWFRAKLEKKT